jgi:hypothetical protein
MTVDELGYVTQNHVRLGEGKRTSRRTVADAIEVVRELLGPDDIGSPHIQVGEFELPSGQTLALADVVFPEFGCRVSLPTSFRFKARSATKACLEEFEISRLDCAQVCPDGSVLLVDGTQLCAVEVIPAPLPLQPSELDMIILGYLVSLTQSCDCCRSLREGVPEHLREMVPDIRGPDFSRLREVKAPPLKKIRGHIVDKNPDLSVSNQKIADTLAMAGIRIPRRRPRSKLL